MESRRFRLGICRKRRVLRRGPGSTSTSARASSSFVTRLPFQLQSSPRDHPETPVRHALSLQRDLYRELIPISPIFRTFLGDFTPDRLDSRSLEPLWEWKNRVLLEEYYFLNVVIPPEVESENKIIHLLRVSCSKIIYLLLPTSTSTYLYLLLPTYFYLLIPT